MKHHVERTSPKGPGMPFVGTCRLCGMTGLKASAALEPVAWQCREKGGLWRHADIVNDDPNLEFRPLYAAPADQVVKALEDVYIECADIAREYSDCGGEGIAQKIEAARFATIRGGK